jgi:hypothetical protein
MKAEEIRKMDVDSDIDRTRDRNQNRILREIAAQLAELNEKIPQFTNVKFSRSETTGTGDKSLFESVFGKSLFDK